MKNLKEIHNVWQYGSHEIDTIHMQDGIAPQRRVNGLIEVDNKSGRAYIPFGEIQGFISSHSIGNYKWIFNLVENEEG